MSKVLWQMLSGNTLKESSCRQHLFHLIYFDVNGFFFRVSNIPVKHVQPLLDLHKHKNISLCLNALSARGLSR